MELERSKSPKAYIKPHLMYYKQFIVGQDPTNVQRVMLIIRETWETSNFGGSAVSAIEMAILEMAGKAAGLPVYKMLGGKIKKQSPRVQRWSKVLHERKFSRRLRRC